ncbi:MAG: site-2 protease family protein [Clostridium sp.]
MKKKIKILLLDFLLLVVAVIFTEKFLTGILWVLLHEGVHIITARKFGCKLYSFNLNIMGTSANLSDVEDLSSTQKIILYLSGPVFNLLMALIFYLIGENTSSSFINDSLILNLTLGIFNLIPAYPLDGSKILESLLSKKLLYKKAKSIIGYVSYFIAAIFLFLGFITIIHRINISLFLTSALITYTTFTDREKTMYIMMGDIIKKRTRIINKDYIENKSISVYYKKGLVNLMGLVDKNKFNTFYILDEEMKLLKIIHEDELIEALKEYGNITVEEYIKESE